MRSEALASWLDAGSPPPLAVNVRDGSVMVYVPGGEFEMGDGREGDCPAHRVHLDAYYIGVYAVTNAQYAGFRAGHAYSSGKSAHPVVEVSFEDAKAYAAWAGLSLATEAQWERAARGPGGLIYPWGEQWDESRCRNSRNRGSEETCSVHGYPVGVSGFGTYNQSGNVWEWCSDWYESDYYGSSPRENPTGPESGSRRVDRGGCWRGDVPGNFRGADRDGFAPGYRDGYLGFRLVRAAS